MIRNITAIKGAYIFFQSCLLIIFILIPVYFLCSNYVNKYFEQWLVEVDKTTETALRHLLISFEPVPGVDDEKYHISLIDQKTGEYVYEQGKRADGLEKLWERYRTKLIYEMQKQKRGWIFYPEKGAWWAESGQRVIRYVPIDDRGWILALETSKESEPAIWRENLSPKFNLALLLVLTVGPLFFWFLTSNAFAAVQRLMKESIERSLISLSNEDLIGDDLKLGQPLGDSPRKGEPFPPEKESFQDSVSAGSVEQAAFDHKMDVKNYKFELDAPPQVNEARGVLHHPEKDIFSHQLNIAPSKKVVEKKESPKPEPKPDPAPKTENDNEALLDNLTVNFDNIKSSVLKNMIKRMRKDS